MPKWVIFIICLLIVSVVVFIIQLDFLSSDKKVNKSIENINNESDTSEGNKKLVVNFTKPSFIPSLPPDIGGE